MEIKIISITIAAFIIIVVLPAIGILLLLDKKDPKRRKIPFFSNPNALYFFGRPIPLRYIVVSMLGFSILSWTMDLPIVVYIIYSIFILLAVRRTKGKKRK